jgi:hypothetical protein
VSDVRYPDRSCNHCGNSIEQCECDERSKAHRADKVEQYLLAIAVQVKPGVVKFNQFLCFDCLGGGDPFMVSDALWLEAWPTYTVDRRMMRARYETMYPEHHEPALKPGHTRTKKGRGVSAILCFPCLEKRLGRRLVEDDFTHHSINNPIRFGHMMGRRELLAEMAANSQEDGG